MPEPAGPAERYRLLVERLGRAARLIQLGDRGLPVMELLLAAAREATGAIGATYLEIANDSARIVAADGEMEWCLGQPFLAGPPDEHPLPDPPADPWLLRTEVLAPSSAASLSAHGIGYVAGHAVRVDPGQVGTIHLYFRPSEPPDWDQTEPVLRLVAVLGRQAAPAPPRDRAEDDRTLFLTVMGHELRTPVTVVKGYAGVLAGRWDELDEAGRHQAAVVLSQRADDLARLVDRMLAATAGDAARVVRTVAFDPLPVLVQAAASLPADQRRLLRARLPATLPAALGDPAALASVMAELVTNAARATSQAAAHPTGPAGTPLPAIELHAGADTQTVFLQVLDRGRGIDPADVERAFERFWRAGHGEGGGGVGLGLYLVRLLVERQHGWVSLRPREGGGTLAEVRLPRAPITPPGRGAA